MEFLAGINSLVLVDTTVLSERCGDSFDFVIKSENGYGENSEENLVKIPMAAFVADGEELDSEMVFPGNFLPMVDDQGNQMQGLVLAVN